MISQLRGVLVSKEIPDVEIDVSGVCYALEVSQSSFNALPNVGDSFTIFTHMVVREDAQLLYGFSSEHERALFRQLIKVSGVGPKVALSILSHVDVATFTHSVLTENLLVLTQVPGIGKKTAERLIIELRDKVNDTLESQLPKAKHALTNIADSFNSTADEAIAALVTLGYKPQLASRVVTQLANNNEEELTRENLIRLALQGMSR